MNNVVKMLGLGVLVSAAVAGGAGAASAAEEDVRPLARHCHLNAEPGVGHYEMWWRGCSPSGDKVRLSTTTGPRTVCVEYGQDKMVGWNLPVYDAVRIGSCP